MRSSALSLGKHEGQIGQRFSHGLRHLDELCRGHSIHKPGSGEAKALHNGHPKPGPDGSAQAQCMRMPLHHLRTSIRMLCGTMLLQIGPPSHYWNTSWKRRGTVTGVTAQRQHWTCLNASHGGSCGTNRPHIHLWL